MVTDTGMGIAPDAMEHMFTPFYTTKDKGTGLGLPFARKIAERHGGTLELLSQLNAGTTVRLSIPGEPEAKGSLTDE
ncbi:MAG: ATP-binding protein [Deltaproteobacteria bacterium]|nr:ATP-binding protein [Deltaproteobacteria bacterium]